MAAFLVITILTWAAVSVSGTTLELSTTTGDTVNIPCPFGEGTLSKIVIKWYYNNSTTKWMILNLVNGVITKKAEYENRASLPDDYSKLILKEITVADEGSYRCVVNTLKQPTVSNIETKLNVFNVPNTPGKKTCMPIIHGMIIGICIGLLVAPITRFVYSLKAKGQRLFRRDENDLDESELNQDNCSVSLPSSSVRHPNVNRTNPVTPSSLDILERFIISGLHPKGDEWVDWPHKKTVVCLIHYSYNSKEIVIRHNDPHPKHAEEILIEYINSKLDKTKIKCIKIYLQFSSCTQCSGKLQILKKQIPDLQIKFSAFYHIRRQSCTETCHCHTNDPKSFKMLKKLDARPFQNEDWDDLIDLLMEDGEKKGHPTSDLGELRYGDKYGVWRNEEDDKMLADYP